MENVLLSDTQPESGTTTYTYIAGTRLLGTKTDAKGTVFTYSYDANDRVIQIAGGGQTKTFAIRQARNQALRWSTFRAAFGLLSERRAHRVSTAPRDQPSACTTDSRGLRTCGT